MTSAAPTLEVISTAGFTWEGVAHRHLDAQGRNWVAYYAPDRTLHLRQPGGGQVVLNSARPEQGASSGLAMTDLAEGVGVLWRDKFPEKGLYLAQSERLDAPPMALGGDTEALARIKALRTDSQVHLAWLGEKAEPQSPLNNIYFRTLDLATQQPTPIQKLMPGLYPTLVQDGAGNLMVFSWYYYGESRRIFARFRAADADGFGEELTIAVADDITPVFNGYHINGHWFLFWGGRSTQEDGNFEYQGASSADQGRTWTPIRFASADFDVGSQSLAWDAGGNIVMAVSGTQKGEKGDRREVRLTRSADNGRTWSPLLTLRPAKLDKNYDARHPRVIMGAEPGQVLVVWEDWREIRSRVYCSFSRDYGQTWVLDNIPLPVAPNTNLHLRYDNDPLYREGERYRLLVTQALDDALDQARLLEVSFTIADLEEAAQQTRTLANTATDAVTGLPNFSEERLRQRATDYWSGMTQQAFTITYNFLDPFYRARYDLMGYLKNLGRIVYKDYVINEVRIDGVRAEVNGLVRASVPAFRSPGGATLSQPEREVRIRDTWLWMGDDWYREAVDAVENQRITRY